MSSLSTQQQTFEQLLEEVKILNLRIRRFSSVTARRLASIDNAVNKGKRKRR